MTYYTRPGGGGVLASGNAYFVYRLSNAPYIYPEPGAAHGARGHAGLLAHDGERLLGLRGRSGVGVQSVGFQHRVLLRLSVRLDGTGRVGSVGETTGPVR